jgi:hypothetical protein
MFGVHALGDEGLAEEMAQEAFIKFCRRAGSYGSARGRCWPGCPRWLARRPTTSPGVPPPGRSCRRGLPAAAPHARFLDVLRCAGPTTGDAIREWILDGVLVRERGPLGWHFPVGGTTGGARTRQQAVTVATLLATPTEIAAAQAMTVIDEFAPDSAL